MNVQHLSLSRAVAVVVLGSVCFSILGGAAGYFIGTMMPGYYRSVFTNGHTEHFDPVQVGVGQGVTQGLVGGALIGLLIVAIVAWRSAQSQRL